MSPILALYLALVPGLTAQGPLPGGAPVGVSSPGAAAETDTIFDVTRGDRLGVKNFEGRILVESWDEDEVEVVADPRSRSVEVSRGNGEVELRDRSGRSEDRTYRIRVPRWMEVEIRSIEASVRAEGLEGGLLIRTVEGNVQVRGGRGTVRAHSVDGMVEVEDVAGDVVASSADDDVVIRSVRGSVRIENVDGDIRLRDVEADRIEAMTVDGDVGFDGVLRAGGEYRLRTHDGDLTVRIPDAPDVRVLVSTHEGEFQSDFPVTLDRLRGGREFRFTLGEGSAELRLEAFDGEIRLLRR